jgi:cell migration-inducing and hyaluronan-binding protein
MEKVEQADRPCGLFSFGNVVALAVLAIVLLGLVVPCYAAPDICNGEVTNKALPIGAEPPDLLVEHTCKLTGTLYYYNHVNIIAGGRLIFVEPPTASTATSQDFWATSIIIENGGQMLAGVDYVSDTPSEGMVQVKPYGSNGKTLNIHLYGADPRKNDPTQTEGAGVPCASPLTDARGNAVSGPCGVPLDVWNSNGTADRQLPGGVTDRFYRYGPLHGDTKLNAPNEAPNPKQGYFGYKVLAVSYGGTLQLRGLKGTSLTHAPNPAAPQGSPERIGDIAVLLKQPEELTPAEEPVITNSGADWTRLAQYEKGKKELKLDRNVGGDWMAGDEIVVTPTDYFPDHYEVRKLTSDATSDATGSTISLNEALEYDHSDKQYDIGTKIGTDPTAFRTAFEKVDGSDPPFLKTAETRAAVALLTRSIRIVSAGDAPDEQFPDPAKTGPSYMYGGHVVFRQGFNRVQIQGVEFKQLGQGGLLGRYPVHFHIARRVPADTYVIDSSVNESMTRWFVLHSTLGVTLARNVGFKSIGHGYFLEDATETDNKFYSNIGIDARAAVESNDNPRRIPGLLEANNYSIRPLKYNSDSSYPTVFWITNGWNALAGNMAAGAGACGACYWYVSAANHDMVETNMATPTAMAWSGYSAIQADPAGPTVAGASNRAGLSPVRLFYKNYCSTAEHALSVTDGSPCTSVANGRIIRIQNPRNTALQAPAIETDESMASRMYFPRYGGNRNPTVCDDPGSCQTHPPCSFSAPKNCAPSVFSHLTSQFNWAETNFSAIWLRSGFLLLDHNFLSDILGPGVTFVTGGDYRRSNLPRGYWGIVSDSVFVGHTQADPFAFDKDKSPETTLPCTYDGNGCLYTKAGVAYPLSNFGAGERMYNVYDGPAYEDTNAYLDIKPSPCKSIETCMYYNTLGVRRAQTTFDGFTPGEGYLPNAAIAWKQSNGFYYPPAFHSRNLFFNDVDIRHYVIEPLTYPGTYWTNVPLVEKQYISSGNNTFFSNWSDVDRQTELSDDDGSMTGFAQSISVNEDPFFRAPSQTAQCRSNIGIGPDNACAEQQASLPSAVTARTSPYDHLTTALYPKAGLGGPPSSWGIDCTSPACTGVPIYRQYLTGIKGDNAATSTREWKTWMTNDCDQQYQSLLGQKRPLPADPPNRYGNSPTVPQPRDAFEKFDAQCPSPFVRMAGMAFGQRSVLTVNNGKYFIDTTQSANFQRNTSDLVCDPKPCDRSISEFQPGQTYFVYFLFAKTNTKQIYQIYGGPGFDPSAVKGVRVNIDSWSDAGSFTLWEMPWTVTRDPDAPGVVDVEVDFSKIAQTNDADNLDPAKVKAGDTCQPSSYCTADPTNNTCGCDTSKLGVLAKLSPSYENVCQNVCHHWAVQDIDCPQGGCFGFQFTMPNDFKADDTFRRPKPTAYPTKDSNGLPTPWTTIKLTPTETAPDNATGGVCHYATVPSDDNPTCKVAD